MIEGLKPFYSGTSYQTPEKKTGWFTRLFPTLSYYFRVFFVVQRASTAAKKGQYDSVDWYNSSVEVVKNLEKTGCRLEVTGLEHLQGIDKPVVFIGNHMSTLETFVLPSLIMPQGIDLSYVIKRSLVEYPIFGDVVKARDPVVVDRVNPREDLKTVMQEGAKRLEQGRSLIIFPQHTRTVDFNPKKFNTIGVKLAQKSGAMVVPVALLTWAWSSGKKFKDFGPIIPERKIHFAFGEPMEISGKGQEEHQRIVEFIQQHLERWREETNS